jgi:hypothetical protein
MVRFRYPESRLCEAVFAKGLDRRSQKRSARPLAPHRWIGVELVEFSHPDGALVPVTRRPDNSESDHSPFPLGYEHLPARIRGRELGSEALDGRLQGFQS